MAEESWPNQAHNARAVTDIEYELLAARFSDDGVYGNPHHAAVVTAGTGLSVNIRADVAASVRGHAWYSGADTVSLSLPGNISGQTRVDWVVLRLDRTNWTVRAAIVGGTPGAGAPPLTQDPGSTGVWEVPLALVTILSGAASVTVTRAGLRDGHGAPDPVGRQHVADRPRGHRRRRAVGAGPLGVGDDRGNRRPRPLRRRPPASWRVPPQVGPAVRV